MPPLEMRELAHEGGRDIGVDLAVEEDRPLRLGELGRRLDPDGYAPDLKALARYTAMHEERIKEDVDTINGRSPFYTPLPTPDRKSTRLNSSHRL